MLDDGVKPCNCHCIDDSELELELELQQQQTELQTWKAKYLRTTPNSTSDSEIIL